MADEQEILNQNINSQLNENQLDVMNQSIIMGAPLSTLEQRVFDAVKFFAGNEKIKSCFDGILDSIESKNQKIQAEGVERLPTIWETISAIVFTTDFWILILNMVIHPIHSFTLVKCMISEEYRNALDNKNLQSKFSADDDIKGVIQHFGHDKNAQLTAALQFFLNLKENSPNEILDKQFITSLFDIMKNNPSKLMMAAPTLLASLYKKQQLQAEAESESTKADAVKQKENAAKLQRVNLSIAIKVLKLAQEMRGINNLILQKAGPISKVINGGVANPQVKALLDSCGTDLLNMIAEPERFNDIARNGEEICQKMNDGKPMTEIVESVLEIAEKCSDALPQIIVSNKDVFKGVIADQVNINGVKPLNDRAAQEVTNMLAENYDQSIEQVKNVIQVVNSDEIKPEERNIAIANATTEMLQNLQPKIATIVQEAGIPAVLALCFEADLEASNGNKVQYRLSALGKNMAAFGLLQLKENNIAEDLKLKNEAIANNFSIEINGEVRDQAGQKIVSVSREDFVNTLGTKLNLEFLELMPLLVKQPATIQGLNNVVSAFRNELSMFGWIADGAKVVADDSELRQKLYEQRNALVEMLQLTPLNAKLEEFGLKGSFLEIAEYFLKDDASVKKLHQVLANMGAENYGFMMKDVFTLLSNDENLRHFIGKAEIQSQIGTLVQKLSGNVETMKNFLAREDFTALGTRVEVLTKNALPTLLNFATSDNAKTIYDNLDLNMKCGNIVNGFMMLPRMIAMTDRVEAEKLSQELYLSLMQNNGEVLKDTATSALMKKLGYKNIAGLKTDIAQAKLNIMGLELRNRTALIFKHDIPAERIEEREEITARLNNERVTAFRLIAQADSSEALSAEIQRAVREGNLSEASAFKLEGLYKEFAGRVKEIDEQIPIRDLHSKVVNEDHIVNSMQFVTSNKIHSDAVYSVRQYLVENRDEAKVLDANGVIEVLKISPVFAALSAEQLQEFATNILLGKASIKQSDLQYKLGELGDRKRGAEGIEGIQELLIATFAPLSAMLDNDEHKVQLINAFNKLISNIQANPSMMEALNKVILEKGTPKSQANIIVEVIGEVFASEKYTEEDKKILKVATMGILQQMDIPMPAILNTIETVIDECIKNPKNAESLYANREMLKKSLTEMLAGNVGRAGWQAFSPTKLWNILGAAGGISGVWNIVRDFTGRNISVNNERTQNALNAIQQGRQEEEKTNVLAILRSKFPANGNFIFAGQSLQGKVVVREQEDLGVVEIQKLPLNNCVFENTKFYDTKFENVDFSNSEFKTVSFEKAVFNNEIDFAGAVFDARSFKSLVDAMEAQQLSQEKIESIINGAKVYDTTYPAMDEKSLYALLTYKGAFKMKGDEKKILLPNEWINNITAFEEGLQYCKFFVGKGGDKLKTSILGNKLVSPADLPRAFADKGITLELLEQNTESLRKDGKVNTHDDNLVPSQAIQQYYVGRVVNGYNESNKLKEISALMPVDAKVEQAVKQIFEKTFEKSFLGLFAVLDNKPSMDWHADDILILLQSYVNKTQAPENVNHDLIAEYAGELMKKDGRTQHYAFNNHLIPAKVEEIIGKSVETFSKENSPKFAEIAKSIVESRTAAKFQPAYDWMQIFDMLSNLDLEVQNNLITLFDNKKEYIIGNKDFPGLRNVKLEEYKEVINTAFASYEILGFDTVESIAIRYASPEKADKLPTDSTLQKCNGLVLDILAGMQQEDRQIIGELHQKDPIFLGNFIFTTLMGLESGKPPINMKNNQSDCSTKVREELTKLFTKMKGNGIDNVGEHLESCIQQSKQTAKEIFDALGIPGLWNDEARSDKSIQNLANTLTVGLFKQGRTFNEDEVKEIIGSGKPSYGKFSNDFTNLSGMIQEYKEVYYAKASTNARAWYDVPVYDKKDNHTIRLLEGLDKQVQNLGQAKQHKHTHIVRHY